VTAPFRFPRFFVTSPAPCPYLPGRLERKVFTELTGAHAAELNDALGRIGFRRSQGVAYRPSCAGCSACVSVRVVTPEFQPNGSQRRLMRRHADLQVTACRAWATDEQYQLLRRYLAARHPAGGMAGMDEDDYADMVEHSPVNSLMIEYREPPEPGCGPAREGGRGRLVAACLTDRQADGLSMIYSFFAADDPARPGLGNYVIMDHIARARDAGLPYVYLGYWVQGSDRMAYKTRYRPIEQLGPSGWRRMADDPPSASAPAG